MLTSHAEMLASAMHILSLHVLREHAHHFAVRHLKRTPPAGADMAAVRTSRLAAVTAVVARAQLVNAAANLRTEILDFRGFDSSRILISRGGIVMSVETLQEMLSQRIVVGTILVGRLCARPIRKLGGGEESLAAGLPGFGLRKGDALDRHRH